MNTKETLSPPRVLLLSCSQIESTLCFLDGIITANCPHIETYKFVLGTRENLHIDRYPDSIKASLVKFILDHDVSHIFVSLIEYSLLRAKDLLRFVRANTDVTIVAGGPYVIEYPQETINEPIVDIACYSHALYITDIFNYSAALEKVPNIYFKDLLGNAIRTAPKDIGYAMDQFPQPNWSLDNLYVLYDPIWYNVEDSAEDNLGIVSLDGKANTLPVYHHQVPAHNTGVLLVSVGCPVNTCKFCSIARMYLKEVELNEEELGASTLRKVSFYSVENIISCLKNLMSARPAIEYVLFNDNDFAAMPPASATEFSVRYKNEIGLPFYCQSSPHLTSAQGRDFLQKLVDAGLDTYCMGVQTTAGVNREVYERTGSNKFILKAINLVAEFVVSSGIHMALDFINANPKESRSDVLGTIALIRTIPTPWDLCIHNLTLSNYSELYQELWKNRQKKSSIDTENSDYHNIKFENFLSLPEPYLNILLEAMDGLHDDLTIGRLPRKFDKFRDDYLRELADTNHEIINISQLHPDIGDTMEFLLLEQVIYLFNSDTSLLRCFYNNLPPTRYGYHNEGRETPDKSIISTAPLYLS